MTLIFERPMSAKPDGWSTDGGPWSIVTDSTAPKSPSLVAAQVYPAGTGVSGGSPAILERGLGSAYGTIYSAYWVKLSTNWRGHPSSVNKVMHYWIAGVNRVYTLARGQGTGALRWEIATQGATSIGGTCAQGASPCGGGEANLAPNMNVAAANVVRGVWYRLEVLLSNTSIDWWVNGVQVGHYANLQLAPAGSLWQTFMWSPTWGGNTGENLSASQTMWVDHIRVSGK